MQVGYNGSNDACIGDCKTSTAPLSGAPQSFRNQSYVSFKHACTCWVLSRCPPLFAINHHMLPLPPTDCLKDNPTFDSAGWSAVELNLYGCSLILLSRRGDYVHQQLPPDVGQTADCPSWSNFEISDFSFNSPLAVELLYWDFESGSELY